MRLIKPIIYVTMSLLTLTGCESFFDKKPYALAPESYFNNEAELNSVLNGAYGELTNNDGLYSEVWFYLAGGDDLSVYDRKSASGLSAMMCNLATSSDKSVTSLWYSLYQGINRASVVLENVDKVDISEEKKARYKAEARFLRAYYYAILVQCWGDVPFYTESTQSVFGLDKPREDRQKIYDFILSEMEDAANNGLINGSSADFHPGRLSTSAAWGIMARIYLFRAGEHYRQGRAANEAETTTYFAKAAECAKKVMNDGFALSKNYWDLYIDLAQDKYNSVAKESIWEAEFAGDNSTTAKAAGRLGNVYGCALFNKVNLERNGGKEDPGFSYNFIDATPKLYNLYEANGDKERMNWSISPYASYTVSGNSATGRVFYPGKLAEIMADDSYGNGYRGTYSYGAGDVEKNIKYMARPCGKFRREYEVNKKDKNNTPINFPILHYSDVLLMAAEALNETGKTDEALGYINQVRERAGIAPLPSGLSKEEFRQKVKDERAMELCFEMTRRFDLIRWGDFVKNMQEVKAMAAEMGKAGTWHNNNLNNEHVPYFDVSTKDLHFPIPDREMSVNKAITTNNPGW